MSHFQCGKCGVTQVDGGVVGYTAGCCHHPPEDDRKILMSFGGDSQTEGFYRGSFYRSENGYKDGRAVQPTEWADIREANL